MNYYCYWLSSLDFLAARRRLVSFLRTYPTYWPASWWWPLPHLLLLLSLSKVSMGQPHLWRCNNIRYSCLNGEFYRGKAISIYSQILLTLALQICQIGKPIKVFLGQRRTYIKYFKIPVTWILHLWLITQDQSIHLRLKYASNNTPSSRFSCVAPVLRFLCLTNIPFTY